MSAKNRKLIVRIVCGLLALATVLGVCLYLFR